MQWKYFAELDFILFFSCSLKFWSDSRSRFANRMIYGFLCVCVCVAVRTCARCAYTIVLLYLYLYTEDCEWVGTVYASFLSLAARPIVPGKRNSTHAILEKCYNFLYQTNTHSLPHCVALRTNCNECRSLFVVVSCVIISFGFYFSEKIWYYCQQNETEKERAREREWKSKAKECTKSRFYIINYDRKKPQTFQMTKLKNANKFFKPNKK